MDIFRRLSLLAKMTLSVALVLLIVFLVAGYLNYRQERENIVRVAVEKARILAGEAIRTREYLSDHYLSGDVELTAERFGLIPVVASGHIGEKVADELGYDLKQVAERYRNPDNVPDAFEAEALKKFRDDPNLKEYYAPSSVDGKAVFRYLRPFGAQESCLQCHGDPADAPDFVLERYPSDKDKAYHYQLGEVIGAASITIPVENIKTVLSRNMEEAVTRRIVAFLALVLALFFLTRRAIIRPLRRLAEAMNNVIETGSFRYKLTTRKQDEIGRLIATFNTMADHLQEKTEHLEESERRFRILTETARDAIISFLGNGQIILYNRRAEEIFGYLKQDAIGFPIDRLIHEESNEVHRVGVENYLREKADTALSRLHRVVGKRRDGRPVPLEVSLAMAESDGHIFYTAILRETASEPSTPSAPEM